MKIILKINKELREYELDDNFTNKLEILLQLIESSLKIGKKFFNLEINNKLISSDFDLYDNCTIYLKFRFGFFNAEFMKLKFNDIIHYLPSTLLSESNVIRVIMFDDSNNKLIDTEEILTFKNKKFKSTKCITNWLNLSFEIDSYLNLLNKSNSDLVIPKPLPDNKLPEYIGENSFSYLNILEKEELCELATLCDYLDIPYLLETICAFISEKYIKNSTTDEIKEFFN